MKREGGEKREIREEREERWGVERGGGKRRDNLNIEFHNLSIELIRVLIQ